MAHNAIQTHGIIRLKWVNQRIDTLIVTARADSLSLRVGFMGSPTLWAQWEDRGWGLGHPERWPGAPLAVVPLPTSRWQ